MGDDDDDDDDDDEQVGDVQIDQVGWDVVVERIVDMDQLDHLPILIGKDISGISILDQRFEVERVNRAELVDAANDDDGRSMHLGGSSDHAGADGGDQTSVGEDGMGAEDDLIDP